MKFVIALLLIALAVGVLIAFRQKNHSPRTPKGFAKVYDFKTKTTTNIPVAELAPGMVQVRLQGTDEIVWAKASEMKMGEYRHPPFTDDARKLLIRIQETLNEAYPHSVEFWEDGFRRDINAEQEIALWLHISNIYARFTAESHRSLEEKKDAFRLLVGCSTGTKETVFEIAKPTVLDHEKAKI